MRALLTSEWSPSPNAFRIVLRLALVMTIKVNKREPVSVKVKVKVRVSALTIPGSNGSALSPLLIISDGCGCRPGETRRPLGIEFILERGLAGN